MSKASIKVKHELGYGYRLGTWQAAYKLGARPLSETLSLSILSPNYFWTVQPITASASICPKRPSQNTHGKMQC